jgi:hypothetical protein
MSARTKRSITKALLTSISVRREQHLTNEFSEKGKRQPIRAKEKEV